MSNKIICIHPDDEDLSFLKPLTAKLSENLDSNIVLYYLSKDVELHYLAQQAIKNAGESDLILLLCHGGTDYVLGQHEIGLIENGTYYSKFLGSHNIQIIRSKKVVCVSYNSRVKLGKMAFDNQCLSFIGFGDIPFEDVFYLLNSIETSDFVTKTSQNALCEILLNSIILTIKTRGSMQNFIDYFCLIANKKCDNLIKENKGNKEIKRVANFIWNMKNEIVIFGDNEKIFFSIN